tara:strand:- start:796 stop:2103 length:1308 start_codon:yes stop_codon:yes gene_type:complete
MSEVKVNKITPRTDCGTTQLGDSGDTVTVAGDLKSNSLKATDGGVIISQSGTNITIGASGDTVSLASGASQSGFGRAGSVDWQTTKKTASFTAVSGEGYFVDTTGGAITMTLPASPSAGDIVAAKDYDSQFATNNFTINRNSEPINGGNAINPVINTAGTSLVLVYVDATQGWVPTQDDTSSIVGEDFMSASGGTISTDGNFKVHTFTGPGTFTVDSVSSSTANNNVSYVVVAGGGGAGGDNGGGGGAGGFREFKSPTAGCYSASPLDGNPGGTSITVTAASFPITVGGGGGGGPGGNAESAGRGSSGSNSVFSTVTSAGGGGGGTHPAGSGGNSGIPGGSGGAGRQGAGPGGTGNTPPVTPPQGTSGGTSGNTGGGAIAQGPGNGASSAITGSPITYSSGSFPSGTGRGGTKEGDNIAGGAGSGGQVIIRYRFQ